MKGCIPADNVEAFLELGIAKSERKRLNEYLHELTIGYMRSLINIDQEGDMASNPDAPGRPIKKDTNNQTRTPKTPARLLLAIARAHPIV